MLPPHRFPLEKKHLTQGIFHRQNPAAAHLRLHHLGGFIVPPTPQRWKVKGSIAPFNNNGLGLSSGKLTGTQSHGGLVQMIVLFILGDFQVPHMSIFGSVALIASRKNDHDSSLSIFSLWGLVNEKHGWDPNENYQKKSSENSIFARFNSWPFLSPSLKVTNNNLWKGHCSPSQKGHKRRIARWKKNILVFKKDKIPQLAPPKKTLLTMSGILTLPPHPEKKNSRNCEIVNKRA